jgi:F-type H+-transporting ATPase subunit b
MGNVRSIATDAAAAIVQRLAGTAPDAKAVETAVDATLRG